MVIDEREERCDDWSRSRSAKHTCEITILDNDNVVSVGRDIRVGAAIAVELRGAIARIVVRKIVGHCGFLVVGHGEDVAEAAAAEAGSGFGVADGGAGVYLRGADGRHVWAGCGEEGAERAAECTVLTIATCAAGVYAALVSEA